MITACTIITTTIIIIIAITITISTTTIILHLPHCSHARALPSGRLHPKPALCFVRRPPDPAGRESDAERTAARGAPVPSLSAAADVGSGVIRAYDARQI